MCGRFALSSTQEQIAAVLPGLIFERTPQPRYNIAPTQDVAAVLNDGRRVLSYLRWGLIPFWAKDPAIGARMINARAETLAEKPSFRTPLKSRRCVIFADGFYEWRKDPGKKTKTPMFFRVKSEEPFAFAGLWDRWRDPAGDDVTSCTIITTTPNELLVKVHNRMPAILLPEHYDAWLQSGDVQPAKTLPLLAPYPADRMIGYEVSTSVNRPSFDDPSCIEPVEG